MILGTKCTCAHKLKIVDMFEPCTCSRSMLPDVVDDFRLANPYSKGHEAIFYSFYVFFTKFAAGISLGVSTLCLE